MDNQISAARKNRMERLKKRINEECTRIPTNAVFINSLNSQLRQLESEQAFEKLLAAPCPFKDKSQNFNPSIHKPIGNPNSTDGIPF